MDMRRFAFLVALLALGCSAMVNPDESRFGPGMDAGPGSVDAGPGVDAGPSPACGVGEVLCGGACVDLASDAAHCGACGNACEAGFACTAGDCVCPPGSPVCAGIGNPNDCGGVECGPTEWCIGGRCECGPGFTELDGACVDLASDPDHCGAPGNECERGVCARGECVDGCPMGTRRCGDACVRSSDPRHCGECGRACDADQVCVRGDCREYDAASCLTCPCASCDEDACCEIGDLGAICVPGERCPVGL